MSKGNNKWNADSNFINMTNNETQIDMNDDDVR